MQLKYLLKKYSLTFLIKISDSIYKEDIINQLSIDQNEYHGFRIQAIINIANKYNGECLSESRNKMFNIVVVICFNRVYF